MNNPRITQLLKLMAGQPSQEQEFSMAILSPDKARNMVGGTDNTDNPVNQMCSNDGCINTACNTSSNPTNTNCGNTGCSTTEMSNNTCTDTNCRP